MVPKLISSASTAYQKHYLQTVTLTNLIPELLQQLDDELISFNPAVELAALKEKE